MNKHFTIHVSECNSDRAIYEIVTGYSKNELPDEVIKVLNFHSIDYDVRHKKYGGARFHTMIELTIYDQWTLFNSKLKEYIIGYST